MQGKVELYLIRIRLKSRDEGEWELFLQEAGEPLEFDSPDQAREVAARVASGESTFDLWEPYKVVPGTMPEISRIWIVRVEEVLD